MGKPTAVQIAAGVVAVARLLDLDPEEVLTQPIYSEFGRYQRRAQDDISKAKTYVCIALRAVVEPGHGRDMAIARGLNVANNPPSNFVAVAVKNKKPWWRDYIYHEVVTAIQAATPPPEKVTPAPMRMEMLKELAASVRNRHKEERS